MGDVAIAERLDQLEESALLDREIAGDAQAQVVDQPAVDQMHVRPSRTIQIGAGFFQADRLRKVADDVRMLARFPAATPDRRCRRSFASVIALKKGGSAADAATARPIDTLPRSEHSRSNCPCVNGNRAPVAERQR